MKRLIAIVLAAMMIFSSLTMLSSAAPSAQCLKFDSSGAYAYFSNFTAIATNSILTFDLAMSKADNGIPLIKVNGDNVIITPSYVQIGENKVSISWGEQSVKHWRRVSITYLDGNVTLALDGETVASGAGTFGSSGMYFLCFPGITLIDNLKVVSAGAEMLNIVFEDEGVYLNHKSSDSTAVRTTVDSDSYYDYEEVVLPDDVEYLFQDSASCEKLSVLSGEAFIIGDANADGKLTTRDVLFLRHLLAGDIDSNDYDIRRADMTKDGRITSADLVKMRKVLSGVIDSEDYIEQMASLEYSDKMNAALLTSLSSAADGLDAELNMDIIDSDVYKYAVVTYMTPDSSEENNSDAASQSAFGAYGNFVTYDLNTDGRFHSSVVDLSNVSTWNGDTATLRFFVGANTNDKLYLDSIIFCASYSRALDAAAKREKAKESYSISDIPVSTGIGSYDKAGNYVVRFDDEKVLEYAWNSNNTDVSYDVSETALIAKTTARADPSFYLNLTDENISADDFKYIVYVYKVPTANSRTNPRGNVYYVCGSIDVPTGGYETPVFELTKSDKYNYYVIDLSASSTWSGDIKGLRVDYFTDAPAGDCAYIDSVIFAKSAAAAKRCGNERLHSRNGASETLTASEVWNEYCEYHTAENNYEYVSGSGNSATMVFRYSGSEAFTARSLGDRMARAISEATDYEVSCEIYNGYIPLKDSFDSSSAPSGYVYYILTYKNDSYVIYINTQIIKDASYSDVLDGTDADVEPAYLSNSTWFDTGISATDSAALPASTSGLAAHSNHENRLVHTPYGDFAAIPMSSDGGRDVGGSEFTVFRIYDDGSSKALGTYDFGNHTSKPNIYYAADGLVYIVCGDDASTSMSIFVGYFDPSKPNADGSYKITSGRTSKSYNGGTAPGGYGYIQPILDDTNGKIYVVACGGSTVGYFAWSIYDYKTHRWESTSYSTSLPGTNRHCYIYGYSDGANGIYLVAGRDVLLSTLGLAGIVYGADYAWDEVNIFHFSNMHSTSYTMQHVNEADYSQKDRELFPTTSNNCFGDTYLSSDGYLHVLTSTRMHGRFHHDTRYWELWHTVYDVKTPGAKPVMVYNKPIKFNSENTCYSMRMSESTDGKVYIMAMPSDTDARCEIWREKDDSGFEFEMAGCIKFSNTKKCTTSLIVGNTRNGSVIDNKVACMYPTDSGGTVYRYFTVTLP